MSKLHDYKLILFDVDKTLTNSERIVTERTQAALQKVAEQGITLGVCTGRALASLMISVLGFFPENSFHVVAGGGQVIQAFPKDSDSKIIWQSVIPDLAAREIIERADQFNVGYLLSADMSIYGNKKMSDYLTHRKDLKGLHVNPIQELVDFTTPIIPVFEAPLEFYNYLNERGDVNYKQMITYTVSNADITAKGINKATGIRELSKILNISTDQIIGVGDSENDDEFLETVGYSVAMG